MESFTYSETHHADRGGPDFEADRRQAPKSDELNESSGPAPLLAAAFGG